MLFKLFKKDVNILQLMGAFFGSLIGFIIFLLSFQIYQDLSPILSNESGLWKSEYVIINKKVSLFKTASGEKLNFTPEEIAAISEKSFVADVVGFTRGEFKVTAFTSPNETIPSFYTELFFEAVPDKYLDIELEEWNWKEEDNMIPIIVPKYYLSLYNFGFAESQGLPQISENVINQVSFNIRLRGNGTEEKFNSSIVGFSDRLNTILVPSEFMTWANKKFGVREEQNPSRLVVVSANPADPSLFNFIEDENYEATTNNQNAGKLSSFLKLATSAVGIIGLLITILAAWIMIVSFQLLIYRNEKKIWSLFLIGYKLGTIHKFYATIMTVMNLGLLLLAIVGIGVLKRWYEPYLQNIGIEISEDISMNVMLIAGAGILLLSAIQQFLSYAQIRGIAKR